MPQALATIIPTVFGVGGTVALVTTTGALTLAGIGVSVGGGLLLSAASNALSRGGSAAPVPAPTPLAPVAAQAARAPSTVPKAEDVVQVFQSPVADRSVHMGRAKVGGSMLMPPRVKDGKIYILIAQMHGEIQERTKHFLDGKEVSLWDESSSPFTTPAGAGGGYVGDSQYQNDGRSMVQILFTSGGSPATAHSELSSAFPDWTASHRADGIATALIIAESPPSSKFGGMFPNRTPQYSCEGDWHKVLDPRTGITASSENPIVHLRDYMLSDDYGMSLAEDGLNDSFIEAMNDCDEVLATGARYKIGGTYRLTDSPKEILGSILTACDGDIYRDAEGKFGVRVGTEINATVSLSSDHLVSVLNWTNGNSLLEGYTSLNPQYTDQNLGFSTATIDPWIDPDLVARYRQETFGADPGFGLVPDHTQARFLSKIKTKKDNPLFTGILRYDLHGLSAIGEEYINISLDFEDFGVEYSGPARIDAITLAGGGIGQEDSLSYVEISVSVIASDTYSRTTEEEGTAPTAPASDESGVFPVVDNLGAAPLGVQTAQNNFTAGIGVSWDLPSQTSLSSVVRFAPTGTELWTEQNVADGINVAQITGLTDGAFYDIAHAWKTPASTVGPFTRVDNVKASSAIGTPAPPQILTITDQTGGAALVEFTASNSLTTWKTEIFRDGVSVYSQVSLQGSSSSFTDTPGAGSYTYTASTIDVSGDSSSLLSTAPVVTIVT